MTHDPNKPPSPFDRERLIIAINKVIAFLINAVLVAVLLGLVGGGVYLLYMAIRS